MPFTSSQNATASEVAASLLPLLPGCEVFIDSKRITPIANLLINQAIGSHHTLSLSFPHELVQPEGTFTIEEAQSLLGKPATVVIKNINNPAAPRLEAKFIIATVQLAQQDLDEGMLHLTGYSPTWLLDGAPHYETFTGKNLKEIATAVAKPLAQVNSDIKANPTFNGTLPFVCRYNESAWNFLKRLAAATGQWLYFNGSDLVFGRAEAARAVELIYGQDCYELSLSMQAAPVQTGVFDYNASVDTVISEPAHIPKADAGAYAGAAFKQSRTLFGAPAHGTVPALGGEKSVAEVIGRSKAEGVSAGLYRMQGQSTIYYLSPGTLIDVEFKRRGEHAYHGQMRIVSVSHHLEGSGHYSNRFEAIPASGGAPGLDYEQPATHPMLARVIDNKDPFGQGRIRASFIGWTGDNSNETDWLRVATPDGGGTDAVGVNRGMVFVPEIGDQIFVQFLENNPDKPYVSGSAFHGSNSSSQSNMLRTIMTKSGHTIELDDNSGGTSITIKDKSGNEIFLDTKGSNITITAPKKILLKAEDIALQASKSIAMTAGTNISAAAQKDVTLDAGGKMQQFASDNLHIDAGKTLDLFGKKQIIQHSEDRIDIGAKKNIHLHGKQTKLTAEDKIEYKAPKMNKIPQQGDFKYDKKPMIIDVNWMDTDFSDTRTRLLHGESASIFVQTRNAKEGESIELDVEEKNEKGEITKHKFSGKVGQDGTAHMREVVKAPVKNK